METWGRYRIEGEIARGACGIVHRATDLETGRAVALKALRVDRPSVLSVERFFREARLAASLDHPGIVRVYDSGWWEDRAYFAMELLEGEPLSDRIARRPLPAADAAAIGTAVARALDHAHRCGVVHRDIKPSNIVLTPRGPVLTDFGLAVSSSVGRLTETGEVVGTPVYMAPEVLQGGAKAADARSDLYSLGVVLYEAVTGVPPFDAGNFLELSHKVLYEDPVPPPALADPILRCLRKNPSARFPDAAALAEELLHPRRVRPRRRAWIAAAGLLLCAAGWALLRSSAAPAPRPRLVIESSPPGARVVLGSATLGHTPIETTLPPPGEYLLVFARAGCLDRRHPLRVADADLRLHVRLYSPGEMPEGTVLVTGAGRPFFVERRKVTCREYARFLGVSFREAPPGWRGDGPPRGSDDAPVTGIRYDDAEAYARWRGRRLPTIEEWSRAAPEDAGDGVREWTATAGRGGRLLANGEPGAEGDGTWRSPMVGFRCGLDE